MDKKNKNLVLKIASGIMAVGFVGATIFGALAQSNYNDTQAKLADVTSQLNAVQSQLEVEKNKEPVVIEKTVEVPVEKVVNQTVEVEKIVKVDNGNLDKVLSYIHENDGDLSELDVSELTDDELDKIVDRVVLISDIKSMTSEAVKHKLFHELDKEEVDDVVLDEDDCYHLRLDDNFDEIEIVSADFDDNDFETKISGYFKQDGDYFDFVASVEFDNGKFDELNVISVSKR